MKLTPLRTHPEEVMDYEDKKHPSAFTNKLVQMRFYTCSICGRSTEALSSIAKGVVKICNGQEITSEK